VEDDVQLLRLMAGTLRSQGYQVITAQNGAEALEVAAEHEGEIHLVLSDVVMPVLGGLQMVAALRRERPDARLVFMSGYSARGDAETEAFPADAAFLCKPFTPLELARTLNSALAGPARIQAAAAAA
jgi:CheY-like chemotaxis protein